MATNLKTSIRESNLRLCFILTITDLCLFANTNGTNIYPCLTIKLILDLLRWQNTYIMLLIYQRFSDYIIYLLNIHIDMIYFSVPIVNSCLFK